MIPLAERMRPGSLDDYIGQDKLVGLNGSLRIAINSGHIPSMILWGPPGVGKTTLANILSESSGRSFYKLSAINAGVKDVREAIKQAESKSLFQSDAPLLFIDEIHRFSKSQQDALLGAVEKGIVTLIGATTENPSFEVISALLSRCQVYVLHHLNKEQLISMINIALEKDTFLQSKNIEVKQYEAMLKYSGGDGRKLYNILELMVTSAEEDNIVIDNAYVEDRIQTQAIQYDKGGENHYDVISAFIKSIRGSDPNAALYYLARMIEGGEDPIFICRRLIIAASEDIGLANPNGLLLANNCFQAVSRIGMPEGRIVMAQTTVYLAASPKSNNAYMGINKAQALVRETGALPIPLKLRNAPTDLMKELNYGQDYKYAHDHNGFVNDEYLPDEISGTRLYNTGDHGAEARIKKHLAELWKGKYGYE